MTNQFTMFNLSEETLKAVEKLHFTEPTPIQKEVIPAVLNGKGIMGQSQTGSGKSHAFLIPLLDRINPELKEVQVVITAPTRELARQLFDAAQHFIELQGREDVKSQLIIGGTDRNRMKQRLKTVPQVIVGTPSRILAMMNEDALSIYAAKSFVVDEADLMIDLGFINEVDQLLVRSQEKIQLLVFSATIPVRLEHFLKKYLRQPLHVKIDNGLSPEQLEHRLIARRHRTNEKLIGEISKTIQPYLCVIFANNKEEADRLFAELITIGLNVGIIHGGLPARERKRVVKDIQNLRYQYIVATDLASRGIDIDGVSHVINAQLPKEEEFYIHRVGRTARAGLGGIAISIYEDADIPLIEKLVLKGIKFEYSEPKNGEWKSTNPSNKRENRRNTSEDLEREAWKMVPKAKRIKPGYKKKRKKHQEQIKRDLIRKNKKGR